MMEMNLFVMFTDLDKINNDYYNFLFEIDENNIYLILLEIYNNDNFEDENLYLLSDMNFYNDRIDHLFNKVFFSLTLIFFADNLLILFDFDNFNVF